MNKEENKLLGFIVEKSKNKGYAYQYDCVSELGLSQFEVITYAKSLIEKGYITSDLSNYYVTELGKKNYTPKYKVILLRIFSFSVSSLKPFFKIIAEIVVALIIAYLIYHFGWQ